MMRSTTAAGDLTTTSTLAFERSLAQPPKNVKQPASHNRDAAATDEKFVPPGLRAGHEAEATLVPLYSDRGAQCAVKT
jgi:hypothetical protein